MSASPTDSPAALPIVPVGLRVEGRRVLVVGAGRIAARKASALVEQGAVVTAVAPDHGPEMEQLAVDRRIRRPFVPSDLDGVWFVVTATGDPAVDGAVFREAERRHIWCNAADDPDHCSVILPAVARSGDITVAIGTGGRSPAVAAWLRRRIEAILDAELATIVDACVTVRAEARRHGLATEVPAWAEVLDGPALPLARSGRAEELGQRLHAAVIGGRT